MVPQNQRRHRRSWRPREKRVRSECGKACFATESLAWDRCIALWRRFRDLQAAFRCTKCSYFHTGHTADPRKQAMLEIVSQSW